MRPLLIAALAGALTLPGCSPEPKKAASAPKVGDKVILPKVARDLWSNPDDMRRAHQLIWDKTRKRDDPELEQLDKSRLRKILTQGDLVEVLEVGVDYAGINCIRDSSGEPMNAHGYVEKWW